MSPVKSLEMGERTRELHSRTAEREARLCVGEKRSSARDVTKRGKKTMPFSPLFAYGPSLRFFSLSFLHISFSLYLSRALFLTFKLLSLYNIYKNKINYKNIIRHFEEKSLKNTTTTTLDLDAYMLVMRVFTCIYVILATWG